jgi:hypothetical protein
MCVVLQSPLLFVAKLWMRIPALYRSLFTYSGEALPTMQGSLGPLAFMAGVDAPGEIPRRGYWQFMEVFEGKCGGKGASSRPMPVLHKATPYARPSGIAKGKGPSKGDVANEDDFLDALTEEPPDDFIDAPTEVASEPGGPSEGPSDDGLSGDGEVEATKGKGKKGSGAEVVVHHHYHYHYHYLVGTLPESAGTPGGTPAPTFCT